MSTAKLYAFLNNRKAFAEELKTVTRTFEIGSDKIGELDPLLAGPIKLEPEEGWIHVVFKYRGICYGFKLNIEDFHDEGTFYKGWRFAHDFLLNTLRAKDFQFPQEIEYEI